MELLIRIVDKVPVGNPDYARASQRGDVIVACPDGWNWTTREKSNPDWIIVSANITQIEATALQESWRGGEPQFYRRIGVDPTGLSNGDVLTREQLMARVF